MANEQDIIQQQARALGDPTRHMIFQHIAGADGPVSIADITDVAGVHHNGVRQHLAVLVEVGLIDETVAKPTGRGRPRLLYALSPEADSRWGVEGPYQRLSMLLLDALTSGDSPREVGRRAGVEASRRVDPDGSPQDRLLAAIATGGFRPERMDSVNTDDLILTHCPLADVAAADPETICAIHLGITEGLAESIDGITVDALDPKDPYKAGCRVRVSVSDV